MKLLGIVLLWFVLLCLLGLASCTLALYMGWPLWIAAAIFFGCIGLYFLFKFLRRLYIVMRSRSRLAQSTALNRVQTDRSANPETLLTRKWKAAVATLRRSNLRKLGNPLYALPWYMVIGRTGTGKTTALTRARLSSPIQKVSQSARIEQTVNYDWWYFDQAVVIDCAGRYVDAQDIDQDRREWELGLDLLARYRPREGLDGLVLALSADRLAAPDPDGLIEEGRVVRARIEQLIQMFGKRFPIYVLVTKCDQLYGMEAWAQQLPPQALEQAMGYLSTAIDQGSEIQFLDQAFDSIVGRLHQLRIALVARSNTVSAELLMFPNELEALKPKLAAFLKACLADNPYLERPLLRGIFFSSGQQEGGAVSALLGDRLPPVPAHASANTGLFLHDFFGRVLPRDRHSARPAALRNPWRRTTQQIGLAAWVLLTVAFGIVLSTAFVADLNTLSLIRATYPYDAGYDGRIEDDAAILDRVRNAQVQIDESRRGWPTRWVTLDSELDRLDQTLKQRYVEAYRRHAVPTLLRNQQDDLTRVAASDPDNEMAGLIRDQVRTINLLRARQNGADLRTLAAMPLPEPQARYTPVLNQQLQQAMLAELAWSPSNDAYLGAQVRAHQTLLTQDAYADPQMSWLLGLVPDSGAIAPVTAAGFWAASVRTDVGDAASASASPKVAAAFTASGYAAIENFLDEMQKSVDDVAAFQIHRSAFEQWYREQRVLAWQDFVLQFPDAQTMLAGEAAWRAAMGAMGTVQGPYFGVLARLNEEFKDYPEQNLPGWLLLDRNYQQLREQATRLGAANQAVKLAGALDSVGGKAVRQTLAGSPQLGGATIRNNLSAVDTLNLYLSELGKLDADAVTGSGKDYQLAADFHQYASDPAAKPSAIQSAFQRLARLKTLIGNDDAASEPVWRLIGGPLAFTVSYVEQQASCELQKNWQANVLWPLQGLTDKASILDQLYGAKGSVWTFADGPAKPFLARDAKRYRAVETLGFSVPFTDAFLPMLNTAVDQRVNQLVAQQRADVDKQNAQIQAQQDQLQLQQAQAQLDQALAAAKQKVEAANAQALPLTITAQPTGVNPDAKVKPYATTLTIQCAAGAQTLNNFNFPVSTNFAWSPAQCGEVLLQIKIGDQVLSKKYPGALGVARFIADFRAGSHTFSAGDFPGAGAALDALNVQHIIVRYTFEGQDAVLNVGQQFDAYEKLQKDSALASQRLQAQLAELAQQNLQQKLMVPPLPPTTPAAVGVPVVQQIGVCWNRAAMRPPTQDVTTTIDQLVRAAVPAAPAIPPAVLQAPLPPALAPVPAPGAPPASQVAPSP